MYIQTKKEGFYNLDIRFLKVIIGGNAGNSSKGAKSYKLGIPNSWARDMEITKDDRTLIVSYDENKKQITITKLSKEEIEKLANIKRERELKFRISKKQEEIEKYKEELEKIKYVENQDEKNSD